MFFKIEAYEPEILVNCYGMLQCIRICIHFNILLLRSSFGLAFLQFSDGLLLVY